MDESLRILGTLTALPGFLDSPPGGYEYELTSGFPAISNRAFNGGTGTINETVTITNIGSSTINGPFQVVLDFLEQALR
jgi:hypothetical protein